MIQYMLKGIFENVYLQLFSYFTKHSTKQHYVLRDMDGSIRYALLDS